VHIFNTGYFFTSSLSIAMFYNKTTNYDFILPSKQDRTQLIFLGRAKMIVA